MTPAACLASPASPMTTITGRQPPSGQVREKIGLYKRIIMELLNSFQSTYSENTFLEQCCNIPSPPSLNPTPSLLQWVRSVHAPVPTITRTGV